MAYDEELADRVRELLDERTEYSERKMFGGLAFMVNTHMACGLIRSDLMVRVGKDNYEDALRRGGQVMEFGGRPMRGMVRVPADSLAERAPFEEWVTTAVDFAQSEPPKPAKPAKTAKTAKAAKTAKRSDS